LGILHIWDLVEPRVRARESLIARSGFKSCAELEMAREELESWSQLALQVLAVWRGQDVDGFGAGAPRT
jgi:predicted NUDIX family phosphoesterase